MSEPEIAGTVAALRETFDRGVTKPYRFRVAQLKALRAMLTERGNDLADALHQDLGKSATEAQISEVSIVTGEIRHTLRHLRSWLKPQRVGVPAVVMPARASIVREPLGVTLIIAPWNYPVQLLLAPLVGAIAAGDAAVLKPSELAPATSAALARLIPQYLDRRAYVVIEGAIPETTELLAQRFDHIFYTGNGAVGRIVMAAAANNLTPVTLELGGKSPVYVDDTVDLAQAADRIAWGKFMNAGQTCVAPDYLLATPDVAARLEPLLADAVHRFYGDDPRTSADYGRIINERQFDRLQPLLGDGSVVVGGAHDRDERYIAPTVLSGVGADAPIMQQEIFGPILPIITVSGLDEAIRVIRAGDKPLALYVFTSSAAARRRFLTQTSSGAIGFGVPAAHLAVAGLPFGGVGESGMGAYHGEHSIDTFSHRKAVLTKPLAPDTMGLVYPPFTERKKGIVRRLMG
ncbi:aldehyde dehydrogenase family protein [Microbacterium sp. STN6]|uniref:aldehyde dehydrogenase family protein n=1 Tax=Microbacterium sp. STN6 TaxID=2995588 RepID=UPI002260868C|nr:aldehyde dehydrogenase family protein [Microbacterium sp. STN6]MCX7521263.1 aldehyde dehydrogenase family protein [Microbacterium sp. STN6]